MKAKEKREVYEKELSRWKAEHIGTECFYKNFEKKCEGHYTKMTAPNRFECDKCGSGLMFPTFKKMLEGRRSGAKFQVSELKTKLYIKRGERDKLNAEIRELKEELKMAKQKLREWM